jgi:hypothetical protein
MRWAEAQLKIEPPSMCARAKSIKFPTDIVSTEPQAAMLKGK